MSTYMGNQKAQTINASEKDDMIFARAGNDTINAKGGNDQIWAGAGDDLVHGGTGDDRITGGEANGTPSGNDRLFGDDGNDGISGEDGNDYLDGGAGNDGLVGGSGNDILVGGAGVDRLNGGLGYDVMTGGAEGDAFYFQTLGDSTSNTPDLITDFGVGSDYLQAGDSTAIWDANATLSGVQQWQYVGTVIGSALQNGNGQATVNYDVATNITTLQLYNNDGDTDADFTLQLNGDVPAEQLQIVTYDGSTQAWTHDAILF
jgi:Ca2+-binding RTX toxin-like protein